MMDRIRQRAQSLLEKLHEKYGIEPKHPIHLVLAAAVCRKEGDDPGLQEHWYLVDAHGQKFRLPKTMLFLGREECDVVVASQSVDKRHAVLTFDLYLNRFKVKDLSTSNGTYVNNSRIPEQEYVTLNHMDSVRLGHDAMMYHVEQGSQITGQGGQLPDPSFVPHWASRQHQAPHQAGLQGEPIHVHAHAMAECQGCIAEQNIEHSCSLKHDPNLHDDHIQVSSTSSPSSASSHRHSHQHGHHHKQPVASSPSSSSPSQSTPHQNRSPSSTSPDQHQQKQHRHYHSRSPNSKVAHTDVENDREDKLSHHNNNSRRSEQSSKSGLGKLSESPTSDCNLRDQDPPSFNSSKDVQHQGDSPTDSSSRLAECPGTGGPSEAQESSECTPDAPPATSCGPGRNTWPRKRARPAVPHVSSLFTPEDAEQQQVGSEARPAGKMGAMYFVAFDDSICNGGDAAPTATSTATKRRPRNSQEPIPAELTTVKKGTPLYGQPSWWGEEEEELSGRTGPSGDAPRPKDRRTREDAACVGKRSRPNSLTLSGDEADHFPAGSAPAARTTNRAEGKTSEAEPGHKKMNGERIKPTYMEIPFGDDDDDDVSKSLDDTTSSKKTISAADSSASTPAKSISSSLSKDSLLDSPDARKAPAAKPSGETATSFTVDLSDPSDPQHRSAKAVTMTASLSQYVPSKIRRNFKDRQDRAGSYTKAGSSSRGSTPSKTSEERELSPGQPSGQRKMEEIWSVLETGAKAGKQVSRLSSVQATAGSKPSSLRSPNLEDIDRISSEDRARGQKTSSLSPHVPRSSRSKISPSQSAPPKGAGLVSAVAQYPDSTSYLIDKMFEGGSSSGLGGSATSSTVGSEVDVSTEKQMYREAAANDRTRRSTSLSTSSTAAAKPSGKPPKTSAGKSSAAPASRRRTSASSAGKSGQSTSKSIIRDTAVTAAAKPLSQSKQQAAPSPPKVCDNDDSDDDNGLVEDDDLQITEDGEVARPPQVLEDGEVSDKASEAGTYVIEAGADGEDAEDEEEEEARRKIDEVFGVDPLRLASPGGYDNVYDEDGLENDDTVAAADDFDGEEGEKTPLEGNSPLSEDGDGIEEPAMTTADGVQTWMSQLNALTSSHRQPSLSADDRQMAKEDGESSLSRKPPQGGGKRPGTGRKLPSIPTTDRSPVSSEHSSTCHVDPDSVQVGDEQAGWSAASSQRVLNGAHRTNGTAGASLKGKPGLDSSAPRGHKLVKNGVANGSLSRHVSSSSPGSARSRGSVDTELLLQDTETVMAAMEARMAYRTSGHQGSTERDRRGSDSDTDISSTVALVNGDEEYVKPSYYTSPRDALSRSISYSDAKRSGGGAMVRGVGVCNNTASAGQTGKRAVGRSYSQTVASKCRTPTSATASPRTPTSSASTQRRSVGSDIYSGRDSVGADSLASDLGSENGTADSSLSRSSSRGKGTITMTKPNRAFQLRRARSDSVEETAAPTTPRSAKSGASTRTAGSSARSSSVHSTNRTRSIVETNRSEATSLGAQIARKSRSNGAVMQPEVRTSASAAGAHKGSSSTNLNRQDGGRHSLRLTRASSLTISSPAQTTSVTASKRDSTHVSSSTSISKSHTRSTPTGSRGNLAITGVGTSSGAAGSSRCHSQPGSRSNSPKAAERIAWRRRKEYDPRKAVAEAKASKGKESSQITGMVTMRPKPHANSRVNRRMIRSASYTNTEGSLALSLAGSVSASQELVSGPPSASDYSGSSAFRRAFLPFQAVSGRLGGGQHSAHSADEDDSLLSSTRTSYDTLMVSSIYQLSNKLVGSTGESLQKLRDQSRASHSPSPCDDFLNDGGGGRGEMTAFRSANQELAGVLNNLRRLERHVQAMNSVLFPEDEVPTRVSAGSLPSSSTPSTGVTPSSTAVSAGRQGKQRYFAEIERIRNELAGFHPIGGAQAATVPDNASSEADSPEMAELSEQF
ncbi:hypothetical protein EGW08_005871 [Elysia chlorotica]|uniref:FHA domain-containing protein n=1 Tax=Elysia chlorotica TaxID=188477 RepID=A0A433TXM8_ELYCH|nr:hypothetical protein EGW08_005871 [Elysia chlorotica]